MPDIKDKLIVALDVDTLDKAKKLIDLLRDEVKFYKIGSQLFTAYGPEAVEAAARNGAKVFLDLKFHDIPNTVYSAAISGISLSAISGVDKSTVYPVFMMTVHTKGGLAMLKKAKEGSKIKANELKIKPPYIVGVTRLTSEESTENDVLEAAELAKVAGLDGIVCSALEAKEIRNKFGKGFIIVTPGIRPKGAKADDQRRVATAEEAIAAGADFIVVGRPILEAEDPLKAVQTLI